MELQPKIQSPAHLHPIFYLLGMTLSLLLRTVISTRDHIPLRLLLLMQCLLNVLVCTHFFLFLLPLQPSLFFKFLSYFVGSHTFPLFSHYEPCFAFFVSLFFRRLTIFCF